MIVRQIFITLHQNIRYSAQLCVSIHCKEILELILNSELERITSNIHYTSKNITKPYLLMISSCSEDLELYLKQYLLEFVDVANNLQHNIKEEHVAIIIKWIIEMSIALFCPTKFSSEFYEWIFTFLHNQRFPRVQKAIFNALNSIFIDYLTEEHHVLMQNNTIIHLEKVIYSWNTYSKDVLAVCLLAYADRKTLVQLYNAFGGVTDDLIDMLKWIEFVEDGDGWIYLEHIKQISDRDMIEKIFQSLDLMA
ncbi:unnamed protein product, partial [Rotaria sordida]